MGSPINSNVSKGRSAQRCVLHVSFPVDLLLAYLVVNQPERKLAKRTSVQWFDVLMYIPNSEFEIILIITIIFR